MRIAILPVLTVLLLPVSAGAASVQDQGFFDSLNKPGAVDAAVAPGLVTASRVDLIVAALEKAGFDVSVAKSESGAPRITSTDADRPFAIEFYGCNGGFDCAYIQFVSAWDLPKGIDAGKIAQWNGDHVWGVATRDGDNDPVLGLSVDLRGGVTPVNFADTVGLWADTLDDFKGYIGWDKQ
ncbi:MAG TPA: YbjN domain-containing protein [Bauldia sp.]|nr:YbjN domain-containing protein [Bauldia sp.]